MSPNETKTLSASTYRRGARQLVRVMEYLVKRYELDPLREYPVMILLRAKLHEVEQAAVKADKMVPVYRKDQPRWNSPCLLGKPCETCKAHAACLTGTLCRDCRRGKALEFQCERATPAPPAYYLTFTDAMMFVCEGLARFADSNTSLQLTFSRLAHLRDASCKVDLSMVIAYADGHARARAAVDFGWGVPLTDVSRCEWTPDMVAKSESTVRIFV